MTVAFCSAPFSIIVFWAFDFLLGHVDFENKQTCLFYFIKCNGKEKRRPDSIKTDSWKVEICENSWQLPKVLVFFFVNSNTWLMFVNIGTIRFLS